MNQYTKKLKAHLEENPLIWKEREVEGILDFLEQCYLEENPIESTQIQAIEEELSPMYEALPFDLSQKLFCFVYKLCGAYEKAAFREGMRVGLHLQEALKRL